MRKPTPYVSLHDVPLDLVDGDCDQACCPDGGLCWPDDPLDKVFNYVSALDDGFLEALGIRCSPPRDAPAAGGGRGGEGDRYSRSAEDMDVGALAAESALGDGGGGKIVGARDMSGGVPELALPVPGGGFDRCATMAGFVCKGELPLPTRALSWSTSTTSTSSSGHSLSSTSWETESPEPASPFQAWNVPRKRRREPAAARKRPWPLSLPLNLVAPAANDRHGEDNGHAVNDADFSFANGGGGRRRSAGRQRNLQGERTCTHCQTSETPQWRAGPEGPGTLCNACGIRFKMNKLLPEYRPSTSPFFRSDEHSNRHRKVVKLREKNALKGGMAAASPAEPNAGEALRHCT